MPSTAHIESSSWLAIETPEFAGRFGRLLTTTRRGSKTSIKQLAASSPVAFAPSQLRKFEQGSIPIDESIVEALCLVYSADLGLVLPTRRPVAIADGRLCGAGAVVEFSLDDPTSLLTAYLRLVRQMRNQHKTVANALRREDILVLARYLDIDGADVVDRLSLLMHASTAQRNTMAMLFATGAIVIGLTTGGHAAAGGITAFAGAADTSAASEVVVVESQLGQPLDSEIVLVTDAPPASSPMTVPADVPVTAPVTAQVIAPASAPAAGPSVTMPADASPPPLVSAPVVVPVTAPAAVPSVETATTIAAPAAVQNVEQELPAASLWQSAAPVETGSITVIDQAAEVVGLATATRMQVPAAAPPSTFSAESLTPNRSGCNPDPSEAVMSVTIPDIAYSCPVYAGGQSMIDAGFVTLVTAAGVNPVLATHPGAPGTLWLAGHRTTHGAAFSQVPDLADGALITVSSDGITATYRVVGRTHVEVGGDRVIDESGNPTAAATWASIIRPDFGGKLAPRLVLQTCEGDNFRWMVYADLVT